jgi:signal transduction histidine kinase
MRPMGVSRTTVGLVLCVAVAAAAFVAAISGGQLGAIPAGCALSALILVAAWWPRSRTWLGWIVGAVSLVSLAATVVAVSIDGLPGWALMAVEIVALIGLIVMLVGYAPIRWVLVVGPLVGLAQTLLLLRTPPVFASSVNLLVGLVIWSLIAFAAAGAGLFLRYLDSRRTQSIAAARRAQRLELARDLHDFVAHDVSGMLVQAQAAQVVLGRDPHKALDLLQRIEDAGQQALASLDRTVHMLHDGDGGDRGRRIYHLDDIADLVARFREGSSIQAHLEVSPRVADKLSPELTTTAYRIVVEALTNVRRHAHNASKVDVTVDGCNGPSGEVLQVSVVNDAGPGQAARSSPGGLLSRRGGLGVPALTERVEALGGRFQAGPQAAGGWRLVAELPMPGIRRRP